MAGNNAYGIDISRWQGEWKSPELLNKFDIDFLYIRALNRTVVDKMLRVNAAKARAAGINFGLYQFFRPGYNPKTQAQALYELHKEVGANMVPQLDIEESDDLPAEKVAKAVEEYLAEVERLFGEPVVVYSAAWWWNPNILEGRANIDKHFQWVARYVDMKSGPGTDVTKWRAWIDSKNKTVRTPRGWRTTPDLWQFSADGNGMGRAFGFESDHLDLNICDRGVFESMVLHPPVPVAKPQPAKPAPAKPSTHLDQKTTWNLTSYTVKTGDGPIKIVRAMTGSTKTWAADAKELWEANGLKWTNARSYQMVHPGKTLKAPGSSKPSGVVASAQSAAVAAASRKMLRRGSKGAAVVTLQSLLKARGFYMAKVDGVFGPVTERAVKAFQRSEKIVVDGLVGPQTWGRLK